MTKAQKIVMGAAGAIFLFAAVGQLDAYDGHPAIMFLIGIVLIVAALGRRKDGTNG